MPFSNPERRRAYLRKWNREFRKKHPEKVREYHKRDYQKHKDRINEYCRRWHKANKVTANAYARNYHANLRRQFFDIYGWKCACCGESNPRFLTLGHTLNDGCQERRKLKSQGNVMKYAIQHPDPSRYETQCYNCNHGAAYNGGICPHKWPTPIDPVRSPAPVSYVVLQRSSQNPSPSGPACCKTAQETVVSDPESR